MLIPQLLCKSHFIYIAMLELAHKKCYTVISHRTYNNIITMMKMQLAVTILINKLSPLYRDFTEIQNSKAAIYKKLFVKDRSHIQSLYKVNTLRYLSY